MEWKTGLPKVSGEYVVYTTYGKIATLMYSAKHKLFNSVNSVNTEEALKVSLNDDIEKWIELDNFVKNYVLSDEEYLKSLKDKEKELWTGEKVLKKVRKLDIPIKVELSGLDILKSVLIKQLEKTQDKVIKASLNQIITSIDNLSTSEVKRTVECSNTTNNFEYLDYAGPSSIKLSKFEFDLLSVINTDISGTTFEYHPPLMGMKSRGHFKDVDPKMKLEEILRDVVNKQ